MYCLKVSRIRRFPDAKTVEIEFDRELRGYPGQFIMLNVFGYEEIPLSLSSPKTVTVKVVGETTKRLYEIEEGEKVGMRGTFGRPFSLPKPREVAYLVAGGIGIAPLNYLYLVLKEQGFNVRIIHGVRSKNELIYGYPEMKVATDDGSFGFRGNAVELFSRLIETEGEGGKGAKVYACGPKLMLRALYEVVKDRGLKAEFSLESYMRCGVGVCGSCVLKGYRVCSDGPVFGVEELEEIFG